MGNVDKKGSGAKDMDFRAYGKQLTKTPLPDISGIA